MGQAVIQMAFAKIHEAARTLHLSCTDPRVGRARKIAIEAVNDGYDAEDAFTFARNELVDGAGSLGSDPMPLSA